MASKALAPNEKIEPRSLASWIFFGAGLLGLLYAMIGWLPYAAGYGDTRVPLRVTLQTMWNHEDWQHCWLVIPVILGIIFYKRADLAKTPIAPAMTGLPIILLSFLLYWAGYVADNYYIAFFSIQCLMAGVILWFFGWRWFGILFFAWFFLGFAWPLQFLDTMLAFPLRMIMSDIAYNLLNFIGIACIKVGSAVVSAPDYALGIKQGEKFAVDIANPCSGIRSLFALIMVSALYAYFAVRPLWKQIVIFLCSIPLAIFGNLVRIMILTFGTLMCGAEFAIGSLEEPTWFHMLAGYVVFAVALGGMLLIGWLLQVDWIAIYESRKHAAFATDSMSVQSQSKSPKERGDVY